MRRSHVFASLSAKIAVLLVTCSTSIVFAAAKDYSGTFARQTKNKRKSSSDMTVLRVVQSEEAVEITRTQKNKVLTNRFPLDGEEGTYTNAYGVQGTCKAQFKDSYLLLESVVPIEGDRTMPDAPRFHVRRQEQWQLSSDNKILTIKIVEDFPDLPTLPYPPESASAGSKVDPFYHPRFYGQPKSWTEKYERRNE